MGWLQTLALFGLASMLMSVVTRGLVPFLSERYGLESVIYWFVVGGPGVFAPLVITGCVLLSRERKAGYKGELRPRLNLRRMSREDWFWSVGAIIVIAVLSLVIVVILGMRPGGMNFFPPFMAFDSLAPGHYRMLTAWVPFWVLNVMGEEFLWRGLALPRQEVAIGNRAWIANAMGWILFHVPFGWRFLLILLPITFILPYVVQRRKNTWVGIAIHAGVGGPRYVAGALGIIS